MENDVFFSVIIPIYKAEKYLSDCIYSVLQQDFVDYEIILVNDGSPDNSASICEMFAKRYHKIYFYNKKNEGVAKTRNFAIEKAKGKFIAFLDADDIWDSKYLRTIYNNINQQCQFIATAYIKQFSDGKEEICINKLDNSLISTISDYPRQWIYNNCIITSAICVSKELLIKNKGFRNGVKIAEDLDLWIRLNNESSILYINKPLITYRVGTENSSSKLCTLDDFFPFQEWYSYKHTYQKSLDLMTSIQLYRCFKMNNTKTNIRYLFNIRHWKNLILYLVKYRFIKVKLNII